ncbi:MAG: hypothetical protein ACJAYU_001433 [Bradymonadia bacterium]|jgi:hypothetical protein
MVIERTERPSRRMSRYSVPSIGSPVAPNLKSGAPEAVRFHEQEEVEHSEWRRIVAGKRHERRTVEVLGGRSARPCFLSHTGGRVFAGVSGWGSDTNGIGERRRDEDLHHESWFLWRGVRRNCPTTSQGDVAVWVSGLRDGCSERLDRSQRRQRYVPSPSRGMQLNPAGQPLMPSVSQNVVQ